MEYETLKLAQEGGVLVITLSRPEVMNALNAQMRAELRHALREVGTPDGPRARCVVLTGTGRAFCSGQDLGQEADVTELDLERVLREEYEPMLTAIWDCPVPVIAAVNGSAAGAGANLALAADVVIAAESATFIQAFTRIGLVPDAGGTYWLPRQIGLARAMGAMLFAERIEARRAAEWGMIWEAIPDDTFEAVWRARAEALAAGPTLAYARIRKLLRGSLSTDLHHQLAQEAEAQGECGRTRDFREGVMAFLEKRAAQFEGR